MKVARESLQIDTFLELASIFFWSRMVERSECSSLQECLYSEDTYSRKPGFGDSLTQLRVTESEGSTVYETCISFHILRINFQLMQYFAGGKSNLYDLIMILCNILRVVNTNFLDTELQLL